MNAAPPRDGQAVAAGEEAGRDYGVELCPTVIHQRAVFSHALARSQCAQEIEPTSKAASEIAALWHWLAHRIGVASSPLRLQLKTTRYHCGSPLRTKIGFSLLRQNGAIVIPVAERSEAEPGPMIPSLWSEPVVMAPGSRSRRTTAARLAGMTQWVLADFGRHGCAISTKAEIGGAPE